MKTALSMNESVTEMVGGIYHMQSIRIINVIMGSESKIFIVDKHKEERKRTYPIYRIACRTKDTT